MANLAAEKKAKADAADKKSNDDLAKDNEAARKQFEQERLKNVRIRLHTNRKGTVARHAEDIVRGNRAAAVGVSG